MRYRYTAHITVYSLNIWYGGVRHSIGEAPHPPPPHRDGAFRGWLGIKARELLLNMVIAYVCDRGDMQTVCAWLIDKWLVITRGADAHAHHHFGNEMVFKPHIFSAAANSEFFVSDQYYWTVGLGWLMAFKVSKGSLHCSWKRGKRACIFPTAFLGELWRVRER